MELNLTTLALCRGFLIFKNSRKSLIPTNVELKNKEGYSLHETGLFQEKQITWMYSSEDNLSSEQKACC